MRLLILAQIAVALDDCASSQAISNSLLQREIVRGNTTSSLASVGSVGTVSCSFETDFCGWTHETTAWDRTSGSTRSSSTGPTSAFQGSYYIYTEATRNFNKDFHLKSPTFQAQGVSLYMYFAYSMYGEHMGQLKLEWRAGSGSWQTTWRKAGDQGPEWHHTLARLPGTATQVRFHGTSGSDFKSDMAVDDVVLSTVPPPAGAYSTLAMSCGFEDGFCGWTNSDSTYKWTRQSSTTSSSSTGPSGAATGQYYAFTEASSPNFPGKVFLLESPAFNQDRPMTVSFKYHMYGGDMGKLELQYKDHYWWHTAWTQSGNQGNSWWSAQVSIPLDATQLRFEGTTGSGFKSDICIDDVLLSD